MTDKEAIEWLKSIDKKYIHGGDEQYDEQRHEAIMTAIKAFEERPKGKWVHSYDDFYTCSLCGRGICTDWEIEPYKYYPFCHCGADMRGDK